MITRMVGATDLEPLERFGVVTCSRLISAGLRFGQFLTIFGDVGFN